MNGPLPSRTRDAGLRTCLRRCLAAVCLGVLAVVLAGPAAATTEDPADAPGLVVDITDVAPAVLGPEDPLTVRGTVTNETDQDLPTSEVRLRLQYYTPISRSALQRWLDPASISGTYLIATEDGGAVPAGASVVFSFTVLAEDLPPIQSSSAWGPRGIEVDASGGPDLHAADRSFAVWHPDEAMETTDVSVLVPVTATPAELLEDVAAVAEPRLTAMVEAVDRPGVTLAVDPLLLTSPEGGPVPDPSDDGPAPPTDEDTAEEPDTEDGTQQQDGAGTTAPADDDPGQAWARLLGTVAGFGGEVLTLPWADADVTALAHAGRTDLLTAATERSEDLAEELGARNDVAWPVGDRTDLTTAAAAAEAGASAVVVPGNQAVPDPSLSYTPTGRAELGTVSGPVQAVLTDERLSAALQARELPVVAGPGSETSDLDPLTARQLLLAETAVIARERPADSRSLLLTLPRGVDGDAAALAGLTDRLRALAMAPWVNLVPLSDLLDVEAPALDRQSLPELVTSPGEVDPGTLTTLDRALSEAATFAQVTQDPEDFLTPYTRTASTALATAWRTEPAARAALVTEMAEEVAGLDDQLAAEPSSNILLINDVAHIPVRVSNGLPRPAQVQVVLDGPDQRLEATEVVEVTVPAAGEATAQVPVHAVGSGTALVEVALRTPAGDPVGTPTEITVRVRADWENLGTAVVAAAVAVMLVAGLVRTARRGRRTGAHRRRAA